MDIHYTWELARHLEPILRPLHEIGFFRFSVYFSGFTVLGFLLYIWLFWVRKRVPIETHSRISTVFWHGIYAGVCWLAIGAFAVAVKVMIVEELDYQERKGIEPMLSPMHFYMSSACVAYLALLARRHARKIDPLLVAWVQIALIAGYAVSGYRATHEAIAGASGGVMLFLFFSVINYDLLSRFGSELVLRARRPAQTPA